MDENMIPCSLLFFFEWSKIGLYCMQLQTLDKPNYNFVFRLGIEMVSFG